MAVDAAVKYALNRCGVMGPHVVSPLTELSDQEKHTVDAALEAARLRFRPILMTAFSFILGVLPLLIATGAGAEARVVMGMTVFSGMLVATVIGVLLVPALYVFVERYIARSDGRDTASTPAPAESG